MRSVFPLLVSTMTRPGESSEYRRDQGRGEAVGRLRRSELSGLAALVVIIFISAGACNIGDNTRTVIAQNDEWTVTAVGSLDGSDVRNTFDVSRRGEPYARDAYLYWDSHSFNEEYSVREWTAPNVLRIGHRRLDQPAHYIDVRNEGSSSIKWMRAGAFEFFLLFDLPSGGSARLPCAEWDGGYGGFTAEGEFQSGRRIPRSSTAQQADGPARLVSVVVTDAGVSLSIAAPQ